MPHISDLVPVPFLMHLLQSSLIINEEGTVESKLFLDDLEETTRALQNRQSALIKTLLTESSDGSCLLLHHLMQVCDPDVGTFALYEIRNGEPGWSWSYLDGDDQDASLGRSLSASDSIVKYAMLACPFKVVQCSPLVGKDVLQALKRVSLRTGSVEWVSPMRYGNLINITHRLTTDNQFMANGPLMAHFLRRSLHDGLIDRVVCLDVEAFEFGHEHLLEVGLCWLDIASADADDFHQYLSDPLKKTTTMHVKTRHIVIQENAHLRNGRVVADGRDAYAFGPSECLPIRDACRAIKQSLHSTQGSCGKTVLIGHAVWSDFTFLKHAGHPLAIRSLHPDQDSTRETKCLLKDTFEASVAQELPIADIFGIFDTQTMHSQHTGEPPRRHKSRLEDALAMGATEGRGGCPSIISPPAGLSAIPFHNAGNDAWLTMYLFWSLLFPSTPSCNGHSSSSSSSSFAPLGEEKSLL